MTVRSGLSRQGHHRPCSSWPHPHLLFTPHPGGARQSSSIGLECDLWERTSPSRGLSALRTRQVGNGQGPPCHHRGGACLTLKSEGGRQNWEMEETRGGGPSGPRPQDPPVSEQSLCIGPLLGVSKRIPTRRASARVQWSPSSSPVQRLLDWSWGS